MDNPINRVAEQQRRTLDFVLDSLGLRHAHDDVVRRDRIAELETAVAALSAENRALRTEVQELERQVSLRAGSRSTRTSWAARPGDRRIRAGK